MAMTLRLTDDELLALQAQAKSDGISMQEAARQAIREYVMRRSHETAVSDAADRIIEAHSDALRRLGE
jgi:predicted transcriptional regulator